MSLAERVDPAAGRPRPAAGGPAEAAARGNARALLAAAVALGSGLCVGLSFPPVGAWPLLLPGLVGAVGVLQRATPRRGALLGLLFGVGYFAVLLPWIRVIGPDAYALLTVLEALSCAAWGWAAARVRAHRWWPPVTAGLWTAVELARSHVPFTGFPWGRLGFAAADTPVQAYVRYLGVPALGALLMLCACVAWWGWLRVCSAEVPAAKAVQGRAPAAQGRAPAAQGRVAQAQGRAPKALGRVAQERTRHAVRAGLRAPLAAARGAAMAPAVGAWAGLAAVLAAGPLLPVGVAGGTGSLTVAAVQGGVPGTGADGIGEQRDVVGDHARATRAYADQVAAGAAPRADVVFWPENSTDIDPFADQQTYAAIDGAVDAVGVPVLVGALVSGSQPDTMRNVGLAWSPDTGPGPSYVKRHLVPFGEYVPMRDLLAPLVGRLDEIPRDFEAGSQPGVVDLGPVVVGDAMCYDVAYEDVVAPAVRGGAELLVVQTNNATYRATGQPAQQWAISRMRALEAGRDLVVAATNGISGVVAADGTVLARSDGTGPQVVTATVRTASGLTPAVRFGGWLQVGVVGLGLAGLAATLIPGRRARRGLGTRWRARREQ